MFLGQQSPKHDVTQSASSASPTNKTEPSVSNVPSSPQLKHDPTFKLNSRTSNMMGQQMCHPKDAQSNPSGKHLYLCTKSTDHDSKRSNMTHIVLI